MSSTSSSRRATPPQRSETRLKLSAQKRFYAPSTLHAEHWRTHMRLSALLFVIGSSLLCGCTNSTATPSEQATAERLTLSQPITSFPPENTEGQPYARSDRHVIPSDSWYVNADRTLWMLNNARVSGKP